MTKHASIAYISGLMDDPASLTDGDQSSIAGYRQSFPYFVPARYLEAVQKHKEKADTSAMFAAAKPYMGNWILFADFLAESIVPVASNPVAKVYTEDFVAGREARENKLVTSANIVDPAPIGEEDLTGTDSVNAEIAPEVTTEGEEVNIADTSELTNATAIEAEDKGGSTEGNFWIQEDVQPEANPVSVQPGTGSVVDTILQEMMGEEEVGSDFESVSDLEDLQVVPPQELIEEKPLISPVYTEDYYLQQGEKISTEFPDEIESLKPAEIADEAAKSLMVMMSFSEWLLHFKNTTEKQKEETKDQRALKTMWQKEKLAAAIEEENEEIPENVFEMAVNSITKEDGLASESLAKVYLKQGKYDKAIDMYRKLSLRNPQKSAYFALKIEEILKEKQS